jgi:hypothetical protein
LRLWISVSKVTMALELAASPAFLVGAISAR